MEQVAMVPQATPAGRRSTRGRKLGLLGGLGVAAAALWNGQETFAGGSLAGAGRPEKLLIACEAGGSLVSDKARPEYQQFIRPYTGVPTYHVNKAMQADKYREWWHLDAEGKSLTSLSYAVSRLLRGKDNLLTSGRGDMGAFVVVTNCEKVRVPGQQYYEKLYYRNFAQRPGHGTIERFCDLQKRFPERILMRSIWEAMPKNPVTRRIFRERCKLFAGPNHLYYHYEPREFPMHMVRDCTPQMNFKREDRYEVWVTQYWPRIVARKKRDAERARNEEFASYKKWMNRCYNDMKHNEEVKDMNITEFTAYAQTMRGKTVRESNKGVPERPLPVVYWEGTKIPKKPILGKQKPGGYYYKL